MSAMCMEFPPISIMDLPRHEDSAWVSQHYSVSRDLALPRSVTRRRESSSVRSLCADPNPPTVNLDDARHSGTSTLTFREGSVFAVLRLFSPLSTCDAGRALSIIRKAG